MRPRLYEAFVKALKDSNAPGGVAYVGAGDECLLFAAQGYRQLVPEKHEAKKDTIYDLASLTKVIATTTAVMLLRDEGKLELDAPASKYVNVPAFNQFTLRHLLTHTSGLVAGKPFYRDCSDMSTMIAMYGDVPRDWPAGSRYRYSDAGFMILGRAAEQASGEALDAFCARRIFEPLKMRHTGFKPPEKWARDCAATEECAWRKKVIQGVVHDENAYAVGGVSGHAGLFSTAEDLATFCRALLAGAILPAETLDEMLALGQTPCWPWQGLGWQLDPWISRPMGFLPVRKAFGHSGWTGTSIWMDRDAQLYAILLSNTCHPRRTGRDNGTLRHTFYAGVAAEQPPRPRNTHTGLDRLLQEDFAPLRGSAIGLLTHHAAVDELGRHILDVLKLAPDVTLKVLYSPEHGIRGQAEAGAKVDSEKGAVPVVSLYGDRAAPSATELAGIDYFVVDLQDVGARYYTYAHTLRNCMKACATAKKPMLVLDRPNPVCGSILEGPLAERDDSAVCWAPVPVRHGMTFGEIALYLQKKYFAATGLTVMLHTLDNWGRDLFFGDTDLPWVPPSPNIRTPDAALLYIGACLFEGTNVSEGRGTHQPFQVIGAPWLDVDRVLARVRPEDRLGCELREAHFVPASIPGRAAQPKYMNERCRGFALYPSDRKALRPFRLALALLGAIAAEHPRVFQWNPAHFDALAGSSLLRERIARGEDAGAIVASYEPALHAFGEARPTRYGAGM